jgi:protein-disulfide isomerase
MKKFTLFLFASLFSALSFAALNPYAYGLKSTLNADQTELTVNYSLNATATNVDFVLLDGDKVIKTVNLNGKGLAKGSYTATVALDDPNMPLGKKLTWKLEVKGNSVDKPTKEETTYDLYCPHGLAIDKNPESEHFGRILVTESMQAVASKSADAYVSGGKGAGIYVFNPDFTTDKTRYSGGIDFTRKLASNGYQPYQVEISEDGRIFVSSCDINGVAVWEVSKDLNTWTPVISGTNDATDYTIKKNGNFFAGLNVAMDVKGSGDDLTLLLYSTNNKGIAYNQSGYRLDEYKLGTATTFTGTPKNIINGGAFGVVHTDVDFIYDGEGGYWFGGSRGGNAGQPNLVHINANGVEVYRNETNTHYGGGGLLVHNGMLIKGKLRTSSTDGNFGIFTIGKDANGKTTLTEK